MFKGEEDKYIKVYSFKVHKTAYSIIASLFENVSNSKKSEKSKKSIESIFSPGKSNKSIF